MNDEHPTLVEDERAEVPSGTDDFATFVASVAMHGTALPLGLSPPRLKVASETAQKRGMSDIQTHFSPFLIFSKHAFDVMGDLIAVCGQKTKVDERFPGLVGFHTTKVLDGALDRAKSDCAMYDAGLLVRRPVLYRSQVVDMPIFKIRESTRRVFVSTEFAQRVEKAKLKGFSFAQEVQLS